MMLLMAAALLPSADLQEPILFGYPNLVYTLLTSGGLWASHAAAIAQDAALQQAIVRVLFDRCLPAAAAELQRDALTGVHQAGIQLLLRLPDVLHNVSLRSTVESTAGGQRQHRHQSMQQPYSACSSQATQAACLARLSACYT